MANKNGPAGCEVKNRLSLFEEPDGDEDGPPGLTDSEDEEESDVLKSRAPVRVKRWSHNASQRKRDERCNNINLLQEVRGSSINGCSENVKEWESWSSSSTVGRQPLWLAKTSQGQWRRPSPTPAATTR